MTQQNSPQGPATGSRVFGGVEIIRCEEQRHVDIEMRRILDINGQLMVDAEITESGDFFAVSLRKGQLRLLARGYVGYIPLNDHLVVYVRPRVPVHKLSRLAALAGQPARALQVMRAYQTEPGWNENLTDLYAAALLDEHIPAIRTSGLLRDYRRREEVTTTPRGRLLLSATIRTQWARGLRHKTTTSWFERTADTPANRCLKYAMWLLSQEYARDEAPSTDRRRLVQRLNGAYPLLNAVQLDHSREFLTDPVVTGVRPPPPARSAYRPALDLAVSLITQRSVVLAEDTGPVRLPAVVLDMNELFENLVRKTLQRAATERGWTSRVLDGNREGRKPLYTDRSSPPATPDVVLQRLDGSTPLVIEVKNSQVSSAGLPARDATNQAATYGLSYNTNEVLLVHPRGEDQEGGWSDLGHIGAVHLSQYRVDLAAEDLTTELGRLANIVERIAAGSSALP